MISFSNELSMLADRMGGVDIPEAFRVLHSDRRWSGNPANMTSYVYPGCGFGGSCLPKDIHALISAAQGHGYTSLLLEEILNINSRIKNFVVQKISHSVNPEETIAVPGLSFKPNSDDVRATPSKDIIQGLLERGYKKIVAYDPMATENFKSTHQLPIRHVASLSEALRQASCVVVLTAWREFAEKKDQFKVLDFRHFLDYGGRL